MTERNAVNVIGLIYGKAGFIKNFENSPQNINFIETHISTWMKFGWKEIHFQTTGIKTNFRTLPVIFNLQLFNEAVDNSKLYKVEWLSGSE
jgi:hypothetical protein